MSLNVSTEDPASEMPVARHDLETLLSNTQIICFSLTCLANMSVQVASWGWTAVGCTKVLQTLDDRCSDYTCIYIYI